MNLRIALFTYLLVACLLSLLPTATQAAEPENPHASVLPYVNNKVVALAYVDTRSIDLEAQLHISNQVGWVRDDEVEKLRRDFQQIQPLLKQAHQLGMHRVYATLRMGDLTTTPDSIPFTPIFLLPVDEEGDAQQLAAMLKKTLRLRVVQDGSVLLCGKEQSQIESTQRDQLKKARREVATALSALGESNAGVIIVGDKDSRRVISEMMPTLPAPFEKVDGKLLAEGLSWASISLSFPPKLGAAIRVQASDPTTAATSEQAIRNGLNLAKKLAAGGNEKLVEALDKLQPTVSDNLVTLSLGEDEQEIAALVELIGRPVREARTAAYRNQRMNNFKHIMLAALNYEAAKKTYPAQAIVDKQGKPLLSWRVAILPYLDQQALYDQFHLDEPWDSEHNLKLAAVIPITYADPDPAIRRKLQQPWYTTFLGVSGPGTIFDGKEGTLIKEVTDGTSNTVCVVEVTPEHAVPWTKPVDWEVEMTKPLDGLKRQDRDGFACGFCDGSARYYSTTEDIRVENWPKMLTIAGGELIEW